MLTMKYRVRIKKGYVLKRLVPFILGGFILGITVLYLNNHIPHINKEKETPKPRFFRAILDEFGGKYSIRNIKSHRNTLGINQQYVIQIHLPGLRTAIAGSNTAFKEKQKVCIKATRNTSQNRKYYYEVVEDSYCPYTKQLSSKAKIDN